MDDRNYNYWRHSRTRTRGGSYYSRLDKNNAGWWASDQIPDSAFLQGISYLIQNNIIVIPPTDAGSESSGTVPGWVKNTAGWWADGTIDDGTFVNAIQYLIQQGLIQV